MQNVFPKSLCFAMQCFYLLIKKLPEATTAVAPSAKNRALTSELLRPLITLPPTV